MTAHVKSNFWCYGGFVIVALLLGCSRHSRIGTEEKEVLAARENLAVAWVHARSSYQTQPLRSAIAEFESFLRLLATPEVKTAEPPARVRSFSFLAHAHLAQAYKDIGNEEAYRRHLAAAKELGADFKRPINTETDVFRVLERLDQKNVSPD